MLSAGWTRSGIIGIFVLALSACGAEQPDMAAPDQSFVDSSEDLAEHLQQELQAELSTALSEVGSTGAIGVCKSAAPAIAQRLSAESGLQISRISRRNRNPNSPVEESIDHLYAELERQPVLDGSPNALHRVVGGQSIYMQAIPMKEQPCAMCHGTSISAEVREAIAVDYPDDLATGFRPGDLRGAILVRGTLASRDNP